MNNPTQYIEEKIKELKEKFHNHGTNVVEAGSKELEEFIRSALLGLVDSVEQEMMKRFDHLESVDPDKSMGNWRNYKMMRNTIRDILADYKPLGKAEK